MHGDDAYCKKHGHDFKVVDVWTDVDGVEFWHRECQICGLHRIIAVWFKEEEE